MDINYDDYDGPLGGWEPTGGWNKYEKLRKEYEEKMKEEEKKREEKQRPYRDAENHILTHLMAAGDAGAIKDLTIALAVIKRVMREEDT